MVEKVGKITNHKLAEIFRTIADLLEIKGEVVFKVQAYRRAADSLEAIGRDINEVRKAGELNQIPGVGKAIAEKIDELVETGKLNFFEKLKEEVPLSLRDLLSVPDLGPKKAALFWHELGITNLIELETAAREGKLRSLPGMGPKSEAKIINGIEALHRRNGRIMLGRAWPFAQEMLAWLRKLPGVTAAEAAGSLRRMRPTVGDIDLVAASRDPQSVMEAFTHHPRVSEIVASGQSKSSVEFDDGLRAQLWVQPPDRFGTGLQYATGSKEHSVHFRELAQKMGLSLSEQHLQREDGSEILCANEEEVYTLLGLPYIVPELREDRGEIEAALAGTLPDLIEKADMRAELHCHSTWSDGQASILEMARAAQKAGLQVIAITDHSGGLGITGGPSVDQLARHREEIAAAQKEIGDGIRILQGTEVEIRADGSLDYPDEVLAGLDIVIASLHTSLRQPREQITRRLLGVIRNQHVDIIGHPTGGLMPDRESADLDMDAVFQTVAENGVVLEINADPARLDLDDVYSRRAVELGINLSINRDAHSPETIGQVEFGLATARRGWVSAASVINTWHVEKLVEWLKNRGT